MSYLHDAKNFTSFTKYISKAFGPNFDAFVKEKEEQFQEISNKITAGELPEDELTKTKTTESNLYGSTHMGYMIGVERTLCFAISSNRYRYGPRLAHNGLLLLDTEQ